jgi:hypothetical protein
MPTVTAQDKVKGVIFLAVKSRSSESQNLFIGIMLVACGVLLMLISLFLMWDIGTTGFHLFVGVMGLVAVILGADIINYTWPTMRHESIIIDLFSARLLEGGRAKKEFRFGDKVRIGATFNHTFHVPDLKPLYGIEFERDGDVIQISPSAGYDLDYVRKLWPLAWIITRKYKMKPTDGFRMRLDQEKDKGGYWAEVHDQLLGEGEKPLVAKTDRKKDGKKDGKKDRKKDGAD